MDKLKNTDNTEIKYNSEKASNTKYRKTNLHRFSQFLQHSASKQGELILQCPHGTCLLRYDHSIFTWEAGGKYFTVSTSH